MSGALIIGGCGHIGSALYDHLVARGFDVWVLDNLTRGVPRGWGARGVEDYRNANPAFLRSFDEIILLAGHSSVAACKDDPLGAIDNNIVGLWRLISNLDGQKLIYASSGSVYSESGQTTYDWTKRVIDHMVPMLYPNHWGLRLATVCGASPNIRTDLVLNAMVKSALTEGVVRIANPQTKRPILAMTDLCMGIEAILAGDVAPGIHDLKSFNSTIGMLGEKTAHLLGVKTEPMTTAPVSAYDFTMPVADWLKPKARIETIVDDLVKHHGHEWKRK